MKIVIWILQIVLALMFSMAGFAKSTQPIADLAAQMPWVNDVSEALVRFIGVSELLGGIGLLLPQLTGIRPRLTALAGAGLALVMVLAAVFHLSRGEYPAVAINFVLGGLAAFVAYQRNKQFSA